MLTVEDYRRIHLAHRDGMSIRAIARTLHHSRRKIRQALQEARATALYRGTIPVLSAGNPLAFMASAADLLPGSWSIQNARIL